MRHPIPFLDEVLDLAGELEATWPTAIAELEASGTPLNVVYNSVISRSDSAALIPEDVSQAFLGGATNQSFALQAFTRIPVAQSQTRLPILSALPVAYWVTGDTGLKQTTEVNWANKYLNIEELAAIVPIPEAVLDDVSFDVWGSVQPLLEQAIARAIDSAVLFGTNAPSSFPDSIVTDATSASNTYTRGTNNAAAGGIAEDFNQLFAKAELDGYAIDGAIANIAYKGRLRGARGSTGEAYGEVTAANVHGVPIMYPARGLWPSGSGAAEAVAYQADQFVIGVRQDFTYKILDQAVIQDGSGAIIYNLAQQDMVAMRVTFRVGWQVANPINYDQATEGSRYPAAVMLAP